ncbi:hypothetical protein [Lacticaseibacillus suihuaensis]
MTLMIMIVALAILWPLAKLGLGWWTYVDATARLIAPLAWTLVVILAPSLLGLLLYLLVGRRRAMRDCPVCHRPTLRRKPVCVHCGATLPPALPLPANRRPLVWVGVVVLTALSLTVDVAVDAVRHPALLAKADISLCSLQTSTPGDWRMNFWYLNGQQSQHFTRTKATTQLAVSDSLTKGRATLTLKPASGRPVTLPLGHNHTVDLTRYPVGTRLTLVLTSRAAQGKLHVTW